MRYGIDQDEVSRSYGPTFGSIDFELKSTSKALLETKGNKTIAGTFHIGGRQFELTLAELDRVIETCQSAKTTFWQKFRFGM